MLVVLAIAELFIGFMGWFLVYMTFLNGYLEWQIGLIFWFLLVMFGTFGVMIGLTIIKMKERRNQWDN